MVLFTTPGQEHKTHARTRCHRTMNLTRIEDKSHNREQSQTRSELRLQPSKNQEKKKKTLKGKDL